MAPVLDLDRYLSLPRLSGLRLSRDGRELAVVVARPHADGKRMASAVWAVDPLGETPPRRLTRSTAGESGAEFAADGSLLFTSPRPDPDAKDKPDEPPAALWSLPAAGGEARLLLAPPGGVDTIRAARSAPLAVCAAAVFPGAADLASDEGRNKAREEAGVEALLFESYPIRHWDHYLGPRDRHLLTLPLPGAAESPPGEPKDVTPDARASLEEMGFDVTPDGTRVIATVQNLGDLVNPSSDLVAIEVASGARSVLTSGDAWYEEPLCAPDGRFVACTRWSLGTPAEAAQPTIWLLDLGTAAGRDLTPQLDLWPHAPVWAPDSRALYFLSDRAGHGAAFRVELDSGEVTCLAADGTLSDLCPSPDGEQVYALRSTHRVPPQIVRLAARGADQRPAVVPSPSETEDSVGAPGIAERIETHAADGTPVSGWLVRPETPSEGGPAPLVVFVHGGPLNSWTAAWHWRWNPQPLVARGYAVLLPDPALSTGYGQSFVQRGWGRWGMEPYTDTLAVLDAALERPDLDRERVALMGGSFGGYMANWVAGHTDRFRAIVTHASLWQLRGFHGTTDDGNHWEREFGDPYRDPARYLENSPDKDVASIRTPMLVIHGERDHRVPISEALQLWTDLQRHGVEGKFLYFPDENHWILKPQNARLWYETVLAFLDQHVLDRPWQRPALL